MLMQIRSETYILMSSEDHDQLKQRIERIITEQPWVWNDLSKVMSLVWKDDIKSMLDMDPELLSAEGFLNGVWREKVTDPAAIHKVFKELQLINNNVNSNTLKMENGPEKIPHRVPVLAHLKSGKTLTGKQAWGLFGCYRLSSVIHRLNKTPGISIVCNKVEGEFYGQYKLIS